MNLTRTNWPVGWLPSEDAVNGDPSGLLRADNLTIDKTGIIGLVDGQKSLTTLSDNVGRIFSRVIDGVEYFWVGTGSSCIRYKQGFGSAVNMQTPGGGFVGTESLSAFSDALGNVLCLCGSLRVKDPVKSATLPLGMLTPTLDTGNGPSGPTGAAQGQQKVATIVGSYQPILGAPVGSSVTQFNVDTFTFEGIFVTSASFSMDTTTTGGQPPSVDIGNDIIQFPFILNNENPLTDLTNLTLLFLITGNPLDGTTWTDGYSFTFTPDSIQHGIGVQTILSTTRGSFSRFGNNSLFDWSTVVGAVFVANATNGTAVMQFGDIEFIGGASGQLNGVYNYVQVNVYNNGVYLAKSPISPPAINYSPANPTPNFTVINGSCQINIIKNDVNANEYWFFRKSATDLGIDPNTGLPLNQSTLSNYNFVGKVTDPNATSFTDTLSDVSVLQLNIDGSLLPNLFLQSLRLDDVDGGVSSILYDVLGLYNERVLYMSSSFIYLSDRLNPDAIDKRFTLRPSGDAEEINLWIQKLTNNVIILATTKTLYEISGTLLVAPDGSIDANIINLGESYPPISIDACNFNGGIYYIAADGLRVTTGSNSVNLSPALRHLFTTQFVSNTSSPSGGVTRHGIAPVAIYVGTSQRYTIVAAHQKIFFVVPMQDDSRHIIVYDTVTKTWGFRDSHNPTGVFLSHAGEVFVAYGSVIHLLDYQPGYGWDGAGMNFILRTVFDSNQQPRNRKDFFTLKLVFDSGGAGIGINLAIDGVGVTEIDETNYTSIGVASSLGMGTAYFPLNISQISLGKRISIQLNDTAGVKTFKLYEITIEYEPRPEQLDFLRILPTNLGTISRKRWVAFAFVIDTLGAPISFTPYLDNVAWTVVGSVNNSTKLTYIFYFASEAIATDMGGILSGGVFEYYGLNLEECVSEKLPTPVVFLIIPANNYGTPNRKRHTSYKYQILTRGKRVQYTPILDGQSYQPSVVNTTTKRTVEHFFTQSEGDVIGIDIGGTLASLETPPVPFEFYGTIIPQKVEQLPDRLEFLRIPNENFGVAAPKRIRTLPIVIDTYGLPVTFTPIVDGTLQTATTTLISRGKTTLYHFFGNDVFGTDYGGILSGPNPSEFYGFGQPEEVEILPVPKKFDQLGPLRFDKIGKIFGFRLRVIQNGPTTSIPYACYGDFDPIIPGGFIPLISGTIPVIPSYDNVYEVQFPKNINTTVFRLFLGPTADSFHRYDVQVKVITSGMQSEARWLPIR